MKRIERFDVFQKLFETDSLKIFRIMKNMFSLFNRLVKRIRIGTARGGGAVHT